MHTNYNFSDVGGIVCECWTWQVICLCMGDSVNDANWICALSLYINNCHQDIINIICRPVGIKSMVYMQRGYLEAGNKIHIKQYWMVSWALLSDKLFNSIVGSGQPNYGNLVDMIWIRALIVHHFYNIVFKRKFYVETYVFTCTFKVSFNVINRIYHIL